MITTATCSRCGREWVTKYTAVKPFRLRSNTGLKLMLCPECRRGFIVWLEAGKEAEK